MKTRNFVIAVVVIMVVIFGKIAYFGDPESARQIGVSGLEAYSSSSKL